MQPHEYKKQLGQNFLIDIASVIDFVESAEIKAGDQVLEIGPGDGAVSDQILAKKANLIAVELDSELIPLLNERFMGNKNFKLINGNILDLDLNKIGLESNYKVIGSLPYNISKQIINIFFKTQIKPLSLSFILQKEVAMDYAYKGRFLNILAQTYSADIKYIKTLPAHHFYPQPKVESAIINFSKLGPKLRDAEPFLRFVKIGFSAPRKILATNLSNSGIDKKKVEAYLGKLGLSPKSRAGELDFEAWINLYKMLKK